MENEHLTLLEKESLGTLKQLQYYCDSAELRGIDVRQEIPKESPNLWGDDIYSLNIALLKEKKFLEIPYIAIDFSVLKMPMNIVNVEKYLQENGVDFHLTLDFINDDPTILEVSDNPLDIHRELGVINGKTLHDIKSAIQKLITELNIKNTKQKSTNITYNIKIGQFIFNNKDNVNVEGKQKDVSDCLIENGVDTVVSWDEIYERFKDVVEDGSSKNMSEIDSQKRSVRSAVTEINKKTEKYLEPDKDLIEAKNNEYWLQYVVDKGI